MKLLYFPTMVIPDGPWLRKAILYGDGIKSIVPRTFRGTNTPGQALLQFLFEENEYEPLDPNDYRGDYDDAMVFLNEFQSALEHMPNQSRIKKRKNVRIHRGKFSSPVINYCRRVNLMTQCDSD